MHEDIAVRFPPAAEVGDGRRRPLRGGLPDGTSIELPARGFVTVRDGRIVRADERAVPRPGDPLRAYAAARENRP